MTIEDGTEGVPLFARVGRACRKSFLGGVRWILVRLSGNEELLKPKPQRLLAVLAAVMLFVGIYDRFIARDEQEQMAGSLNIAVSSFAGTGQLDDDSLEKASKGIAIGAVDDLSGLLSSLAVDNGLPPTSLQVWGPEQFKPADSPAETAQKVSADIVVGGTLEFGGVSTTVTPSFFFSGRKLVDSDAEELVGLHQIGPTVTSLGQPDSAPTQAELLDALDTHWSVIARLGLALDYYSSGRFPEAIMLFQDAISDSVEWQDQLGSEVLHLYLANAEGRNGNIANARSEYSRALEINPDYTRGQVGLAETTFQLNHNGCLSTEINRDEVSEAAGILKDAIVPSPGSPLTELQRNKATLLLGRMHLCMYLADIETSETAQAHLLSVISTVDEMDDSDTRTMNRWNDQAAESWAALAVIYSTSQPRDLDQEAAAYNSAIEYSATSSRTAIFHLNLASVFLARQQCESGLQEINSGLALVRLPDPDFELRFNLLRDEWTAARCTETLPDLQA